MRLIKPQAISLSGRPMAVPGGTQLMVTCLTGFSVSGRQPIVSSDQKIWRALKDVLPPKTAPDLGLPKPRSEWLLFGKAYPRNPADKLSEVSVQIMRGQTILSKKELFVCGSRKWDSYAGIAMPGEPESLGGPLLLDWTYAFGSKDNAINPRGIGQYSNSWVGRAMQQIEYKNAPIASPAEDAYPAGFGPLPIEAASRFKPKGTYDEHWRKNEFPAFPADTPQEQFMLAPTDQRLNIPFLPGDIIYCKGMSPTESLLEWVLPEWQARSYMSFKSNSSKLVPVEMKLDTLWLIPHAGLLGMMWRGYVPIKEADAFDVDLLFGALEDISAPRSEHDYQLQIDTRSGKNSQTTSLMMLDDSALLPKGQNGLLLPEIPENAKDRIKKALQHSKSKLAASATHDSSRDQEPPNAK